MRKAFWIVLVIAIGLATILGKLLMRPATTLPIQDYFLYDRSFPLNDTSKVVIETDSLKMEHVNYLSVNNSRVTGLLSLPSGNQPSPVIIFMHGIEDNKDKDYMQAGHQYFIKAGYAVFRLDIANHGERKQHDHDYSFTDGYRYWTRGVMTQTVFDLQRAIDYLCTRPEIDSTRIGYFGISFGGFIGTTFCAIDQRIKVPVITLAGGDMRLMFKEKALSQDTKSYLSIIDPINFVQMIAPRPLLMLNSSEDEIVPPLMSKALYKKAKEPKKIVWYPTTHRRVPLDEAFPEGIAWFDQYL